MPKPYSYDLRQKVIFAIEVDGRSKTEVSKYFQISRSTIHRWLNRKKETGDVHPLPNKPEGHGHKILDWVAFEDFVKVNGDKTQEEMASLWEGQISARTISRGLKKIGFTLKKKLMVTWNVTKKSVKNFCRQSVN